MDIQLEKANIIERLHQVNDESLIKAFKNLLDYAGKKEAIDKLLEESIDRGLAQSEQGKGKPHSKVMADFRTKFKR